MDGAILTNRTSIKRNVTDFYPTPANVTQALLDYLSLNKNTIIWEPACGKGNMSKVLIANGYTTISTDINCTGYSKCSVDFLSKTTYEIEKDIDWIITNPPFCLSIKFIEKCISLKKPFALLCKSQYWHAKNKMKLFRDFRPKAVLPLTYGLFVDCLGQ